MFLAPGKLDAHIHCNETERIVIRIRSAVRGVLVDRVILKIPRQVTVARRIGEEVILGANPL